MSMRFRDRGEETILVTLLSQPSIPYLMFPHTIGHLEKIRSPYLGGHFECLELPLLKSCKQCPED